jgi:hypothetical protein
MKKKVIVAVAIMLLLAASIKPACILYYDYHKEKNRLSQDAYFTEYKLTRYEYIVMATNYYVDEKPSWRDDLNEDDWPDYSYYTMEATDNTEMVVTVLNYRLFEDFSDNDREGLERAEEYGFSLENPITVEWVMKHPKEAVEIMNEMWNNGYLFDDYQRMKRVYDNITGAVEDATEQSEESTEDEVE